MTRVSRCGGTLKLLTALAVVAGAAVAAAMAGPSVASAAPFIISNEFGGQAGPDVAGNVAVWTDNRNGNLDIFGKNLASGARYTVCAQKAQQDNPAVTRWVTASGAIHYIVVWVDKRNHPGGEPNDIYARDLVAGGARRLTHGATIKWFPDVVDRWAAWVEADDVAGPYEIKVCNLATGTISTLATTKVLSPVAIDRRSVGSAARYTVVYASGDGDISGCNAPDGSPFVVANQDAFEWMPDISGNRVVWWEEGRGVMTRDLTSGVRSFVHQGARPRVDGDRVAWDGGGHGGSFVISYRAGARIGVRNVATMAAPLTIALSSQTSLFPAIAGHRVVWEAGPAQRVLSHIHIYGARLP